MASVADDFSGIGMSDYNIYSRPSNENAIIYTNWYKNKEYSYNLAGWRYFSGNELNTKKTPATPLDSNATIFAYNASALPVKLSLSGTYLTLDSIAYTGSLQLMPYSSAILIKPVDGQIPTTTFYRDEDGDGFGNKTLSMQAINLPPGYVADSTDCNDKNPLVNPSAAEICGNGIDDNCNGLIDENCSQAVVAGDKLFSFGSLWKYLDNGSNQGINWQTYRYNDFSWKAGNGELGYGDGDEATIVGFGKLTRSKYITTYFRKTININDVSSYSLFVGKVKRDDGVVVYVNGVEVFRSNLPKGKISYLTLASEAVDDGNEELLFDIGASLFKTGSNLVAVEIHQSNGSSDDISFDMELFADRLKLGTPVKKIMAQNNLPAAAEPDDQFAISVYPNPTTSTFQLHTVSNNQGLIAVRVLDVWGRLVDFKNGVEKGNNILFGENLRAGVYMLQVKQGDSIVRSKLVKNAN